MKLIALFFLALQSSATLAYSATEDGPMLANVPGANAYEKLANAFEAASPMTMYQLPTLEERGQWACAAVSRKQPEVLASPAYLPVHASIQIVMQPAAPANGPLFPATPAKTRVIETVISAIPAAPDWYYANDRLAKAFVTCKAQIIQTTPDFIQSILADENCSSDTMETVAESFRVKDGMIFEKDWNIPMELSSQPSYTYCWKTASNRN
jgi:hypothetical protein